MYEAKANLVLARGEGVVTNVQTRARRGASAMRRRFRRNENVSTVIEDLETGYSACEATVEAKTVETA